MFVKGFSYGYDAERGMFLDPRAQSSVERMAELGGNWTSLCVTIEQETYASTKFGADYRRNLTDREVEAMIKINKSYGLKVCLKPMINCLDDVWRARITFPEPEYGKVDYWQEWFSCYKAFMLHYAEIAEYTGCEMLCIGCEMIGTEHKVDYWRDLIYSVRKVYKGKLVYNANHGGELNVEWFADTDFIGTSAYFALTEIPGDSEENMIKSWNKIKKNMRDLSERHDDMKIIFMEIGCRSARGCAAMPWDFIHRELPYDEDEQANFYSSCFKAISGEPWFEGFFWWDWYTFLPEVERELGFSIYKKKAERVVREWYSKTVNRKLEKLPEDF